MSAPPNYKIIGHNSMKYILVELNEVNFDYVNKYIEAGFNLQNLQRLISNGISKTKAENEYENIEPWIQWPSVHTGKCYAEHQVFRLGDIINYPESLIFDEIEKRGYSVGNISAMNAKNNLKNPAFFIPDPWTDTSTDGSWTSKSIDLALKQAVNDNSSGRLTLSTIFRLIISTCKILPLSSIFYLLSLLPWALNKKTWRKAIFLDVFLFQIFKEKLTKKSCDFSVIFLNAAAHIQHHFLLSSSIFDKKSFKNPSWYISEDDDPLLEVYMAYDKVIGELYGMKNYKFIIATGLSQVPCKNPTFYYRLKKHNDFFKELNIVFEKISPRMTRDFLVSFKTNLDRDDCINKLQSIFVNGVPLFGLIDVRNHEIFVTLDYPQEITESTTIDESASISDKFNLHNHVVFVAIKNGIHDGTGYVAFGDVEDKKAFTSDRHVSFLYDYLLSLFPKK